MTEYKFNCKFIRFNTYRINKTDICQTEHTQIRCGHVTSNRKEQKLER